MYSSDHFITGLKTLINGVLDFAYLFFAHRWPKSAQSAAQRLKFPRAGGQASQIQLGQTTGPVSHQPALSHFPRAVSLRIAGPTIQLGLRDSSNPAATSRPFFLDFGSVGPVVMFRSRAGTTPMDIFKLGEPAERLDIQIPFGSLQHPCDKIDGSILVNQEFNCFQ